MISIIRLRDGTEVVGDVADTRGDVVVVTDPLQINYKITMNNPAPSMGLSRFMPFSVDSKFKIYREHVTAVCEARDSMKQYYKFALTNYIGDLDKRIDAELVSSSVDEDQMTETDFYKQLLERVEPSGNIQ